MRQTLRRIAMAAILAVSACGPASADRALYYWGAEVNAICPCSSQQCFWVRGDDGIVGSLRSFVQRNIETPYQPVYIEYQGRLLDETPVGFAANYDGLLEVTRVFSLSASIPADCPRP